MMWWKAEGTRTYIHECTTHTHTLNTHAHRMHARTAEFLCPLSGSLMRKAVVAMDACAYEQGALEGYMEACANGE